jgi:CubicO group peptidase (beta-lactamase class C family)
VNTEKLEALRARAQRDIDQGIVPSCQIALARDNEVVHFETFGDATDDSRYVIFSATKAVTAGAIWQLIGEGELDVRTRVAEIVPEFGSNGKDAVTVEHVLTHTGGFPTAPLGPPDWGDREARLRRFADWRVTFEPGSTYVYHPTSGHWVLGEIIHRLRGDDYREVIRKRVLDPLGLDRLQVGVPVEDQGDIATLEVRGEPASPDDLEAAIGLRELPATEVTDDALLQFNDPENRTVGVPGGGGVSDAASLALYYQALLHDRQGIWDPEVRRDVTTNVRNRMPDPFMGIPGNYTLGIRVAGDDQYVGARGFGKTVSPRAFGHNGAAGQIAWADPDTGLSFAYLTNGIDANKLRQWRRDTAIASIAGDCA